MVFEHIEKLKSEYTDKYVVVDRERPELARFGDMTGRVRTVNMSGRALVEFNAYNNEAWYDIDIDFLKVVDKPAEPEPVAKKKPAKKAAAPKKDAAKAKPAAAGGTADILAAARAGKSAAPAKSSSTADILAAARGGAAAEKKPASSTADILAAARGGASATKKTEPAKETPAATSTADILAAARGGAAKPKVEETPVEPEVVEEAAPATKEKAPVGDLPTDTDEILAYCREHDAS